ncbi:MAG: ion transporter [Gammaproteobacteria bacterium]|nr:ion transporter [Gammaproteobacteria bacterium]
MSLLSVFNTEQIQIPQLVAASAAGRLRQRFFQLLERAEKGDHSSQVIDLFLVTLIILSTVAIVLESVGSLYENYASVFFLFEVYTVSIFTLEYLMRVWCCVESAPAGSNHLVFRLKYMFSAAALIDLVAILPFYLMLGGFVVRGDMRFLRMFRLLRVFKLTRYSAAFDILAQALKENARSLAAAFFILLMVMLVAATGMYYFEHEAQPEAFSSIPASMWWAFATLTTVGYGDITPVTAGGKMFGALITVLGLGMVALPTGILASAYTEQLRRRSERYRRQADHALQDGILSELELHELEELRKTLGLDKNIAREILGYEKKNSDAPESEHCCPHCGRPVQ